MCDICGRMFCPPSCPSYDGRDAERGVSLGKCAECGAFLYGDDDFFADGFKLLCFYCHTRAKEPERVYVGRGRATGTIGKITEHTSECK